MLKGRCWKALQMLTVVLAVGVVAPGCGDSEPRRPSRADCQKVREHVAELAIQAAGESASPALLEKHRKNLASVGGERYLDDCVAKRRPAYVRCALAAHSTAELRRCR